MKRSTHVLFASSATALLMGAADGRAADLPSRKAIPVEYVQICDVYGAGFYRIPGTDTCLKIGGRVIVDMWYVPPKNAMVHRSTAGGGIAANTFISANGVDQTGWAARSFLALDARTQSAWGTVQTAATLRLDSSSGLASGPGYASSSFAGGNSTPVILMAAYIRFAGFTIGRTGSNYTFLTQQQTPTMGSVWAPTFATGITQFAYTATFGKGFSATLALEDRAGLARAQTANTLGANPFTLTAATTGPNAQRLPVLVGNARIDQSWGSALISAAVLENTATFGNPALAVVGNTGPLVRRVGWAVSGGLRVNLPMLAAGDSIQVYATYGKGALDYTVAQGTNGTFPTNPNYLGGFLGMDRNVTLYCANAACTIGRSELTTAFSVTGVFAHYWTPTLRSELLGSYAQIDPGPVTKATRWDQGGLAKANVWSVLANLTWSPVRDFNIGAGVSYARLNRGLPLFAPAGLGTLVKVNPNNISFHTRVQRIF